LVGLLAGCGGSGATPVSGPELITKGDELCRVGQQKFAEIQAKPATTVSQYADQTGELADAAQTVLDGLQGLKPPSQLSQKYDAYLSAYQAGVELLKKGRDAAEQRDGNVFGKLQKQVEKTGVHRRQLAAAVGFKDCSKPSPKTSG
jgi:hypothetical protein